jgi:DNA-binding response OmpR family regulator
MIAKLKRRSASSRTRAAPTVLLVESEVLVRMVLAEYLRGCGYRALEASNGDEAMTLLSAPGLSVDALLADVNITGVVSAFSLSQWVRREKPSVKVLLTSSVTHAAEAAADLCDEGPLLRRTAQPQELERRIRALIGRRNA